MVPNSCARSSYFKLQVHKTVRRLDGSTYQCLPSTYINPCSTTRAESSNVTGARTPSNRLARQRNGNDANAMTDEEQASDAMAMHTLGGRKKMITISSFSLSFGTQPPLQFRARIKILVGFLCAYNVKCI